MAGPFRRPVARHWGEICLATARKGDGGLPPFGYLLRPAAQDVTRAACAAVSRWGEHDSCERP